MRRIASIPPHQKQRFWCGGINIIGMIIIGSNILNAGVEEKTPGIPDLRIHYLSCCHYVKLQVGMTGKVDEIIIERRSEEKKDFENIFSAKADGSKEFMGTKYYDENIVPGEKYYYRVYSKLGDQISSRVNEQEFEVPGPEKWFYSSDDADIISFSDMPKADLNPEQIGYFTEEIITARELPEELFGEDIVYVKHRGKYLKEYANYGIYKRNENDSKARYETLWQDSMEEVHDIGWEYTGRFFKCDVTGDNKDELGLALISGKGNLQRVYFFKIEDVPRCIFKNKFNINCYKDEGDDTYTAKPPYIIIKGIRKDPLSADKGKYWFGPFFEYKKIYKYDTKIERFLLVHAKEELVNNS